jgi:hypothetical protein
VGDHGGHGAHGRQALGAAELVSEGVDLRAKVGKLLLVAGEAGCAHAAHERSLPAAGGPCQAAPAGVSIHPQRRTAPLLSSDIPPIRLKGSHAVDPADQRDALTELAESLGISVRAVAGVGELSGHLGGALVRLKGREVVFLNADAPAAEQTAALASALRGRERLERIYLAPELRELLEADAGG